MIVERIDYRGYEIEILHDDGAVCPWEDWEGVAPLITDDRWWGHPDDTDALHDLIYFGGDVAAKHWREMLDFLDYESNWRGMREFILDERWRSPANRDEMLEFLVEALHEHIGNNPGTSFLEDCKMILDWQNIPCRIERVRGYCQGDVIDLLIAHTPSFVERVGVNHDSDETVKKDMESDVRLFGWWAFGDVYAYTINKHHEIAEGTTTDGVVLTDVAYTEKDIEACAGFYGPNIEENGLMEMARQVVDAIISQRS